jgi:tRNA-splicing ligase RtcB
MARHGFLEKIDDYRWRIPKGYKAAMRVDGVIYASEDMLEAILSDKAVEQVANVATLPGIVKYSLAMPDIHWGYGAPIGGVSAYDVDADGVVSPGQIGYDINCLSPDASILTQFGYKMKIKDFENSFRERRLLGMDFNKEEGQNTAIVGFLKKKSRNKILKIRTETGKEIIATEDHPFYTKDGMRPLHNLSLGDEVALYPFEGIEYNSPGDKILLSAEDIKKLLLKYRGKAGNASVRMIAESLRKKNLLPLRLNNSKIPHILKLIGILYGDGTMNFIGSRGDGVLGFYGKKEDLFEVKNDLAALGYSSSKIYNRITKLRYKGKERCYKNHYLIVNAASLLILFASLGVPVGRKVSQKYRVPDWILKAPKWHKRLFLSSFFGAELTIPRHKPAKRGNFYAPALSMSKRIEILENGYEFLDDIAALCKEFRVRTTQVVQRRTHLNTKGEKSCYFELIFSSEPDSLINLWRVIGYSYNKKKNYLACMASHYLALKLNILATRSEAIVKIKELRKNGLTQNDALKEVGSKYVGIKLIHCTDQKDNFRPRIPKEFPSYREFEKTQTVGLGRSGMIWDCIISISDVKDYDDYVYDFTVAHPHHNFIANGFVVSNCGVRLIRMNLKEKDLTPKLKDLVSALHNEVPAGVGSKGDIRVSARDERKLLAQGSRWAVECGYGRPEDLEYTEERGEIKGANPDEVSPRAYERGKNQSGTLGSGNHFLEIQVVDTIYDEELAEAFGIEKYQVTLMIHSGSRGLGYQVCDEYAGDFIRTLSKYGISVPDRQLACAPVNSPEGKAYLGAMRCAANYAWSNRQCLTHLARGAFEKILNMSPKDLGMDLIYDVAHNIAKIEKHDIDGKEMTLCVHRKGATRAFPPGHPELPPRYQKTGQPVIIPGDMGRSSYLLVGAEGAKETFYSTCHGAGRLMSRAAAIRAGRGRSIARELEDKGIIVKSSGRETLAEEMPEAYKDVNQVVNVVHGAGIAKRVCRMRPIGVVKG